jgi:para-nitrobenzyl esterase
LQLAACSDGDGKESTGGNAQATPMGDAQVMQQGVFAEGAVSGLNFSSAAGSGTTDADGRFFFAAQESISFSVGELLLGSTSAKGKVTPVDLFPQATGIADQRATNVLVLLQTLDQDGDLNNGTQISAPTSNVVSKYKGKIVFDQTPAAFASDANVAALLAELNGAQLFTDTDPRPRSLRDARAAQDYFARANAPRSVVATQHGKVSGFAAKPGTWQWLGIPYAKPPLGQLRWKPPQEPVAWEKPRDAVAWSDQAAQDPALQASGEGGMSEDSLYLNVTAPDKAANLPVMVWFHGGAFTILTGNSKAYNNPDGLTNKGIVLVVVNHRLGAFGYLAHPLLTADSSYGGSGNYGQMDLVMALSWVKKNIANFGGNPENVTIFGQSGGCGKVASLMNSPQATGLFQKAVCQSGTSALAPAATPETVIAGAEQVGKAMFTRLNVTTIEQARALPWTAIVQSDTDAKIGREVYRPTIDNFYTSKTFYNTIVQGQPSDVPLMIGATSGDYAAIISGLKEVMPFRSMHSKANLYVYRFSAVPTGWMDKGLLSGHGGELPYLFNYPAMFANNYAFNLVLDAAGKKPEIGDLDMDGVTGTAGDAQDVLASLTWGPQDTAVAETLMSVWTNFAKSGNPDSSGLSWPPYTAANDTYVEFGPSGASVKTGLVAAFP